MKKILLYLLIFLVINSMSLFAQSGIGDVNYDSIVNIIDALVIAQYYVGLHPSPFNQESADVNCDGLINIIDALFVAQYYVGLIPEFPCGNPTPVPTPVATISGQVLFDDFAYTTSKDNELSDFGWIARTGTGGPGSNNAVWSSDYITFEDDYVGKVLKLNASTDNNSIIQSEFYLRYKKFREGTYAANIRFNDTPDAGPDGDQIVETFFPIASWSDASNDIYCELDFEYLSNGGWGSAGPAMWNTTWETAYDNTSSQLPGSLQDSYKICIIQATGNSVKYYLGEQLLATHYDPYCVDGYMTINFNLWFIEGGFIESSQNRIYSYKVDWVYFRKDTALTKNQIEADVEYFRSQSIVNIDTVQ